jgi:hypothetical protein
MTLRDFKMNALISFKVLLLKERKKPKRSMLRELKKSGLRKPKIRSELLPRYSVRESRFSAKCTKPVKTLK